MIVIETKLKVMPKKCNKCKYSYMHYGKSMSGNDRFCSVSFIDDMNRVCPYEFNKEKNNWEYTKPEWCPLKQLDAENNGTFTFRG